MALAALMTACDSASLLTNIGESGDNVISGLGDAGDSID